MSLLLLALAVAGAAATTFPGSKPILDCANKPPGIHGMPGTGCSIYYFICPGYNRPAKKLMCPNNDVYDQKQKVCKPAIQVAACKALLPQPPPPQNPPSFAFKPKSFAFKPQPKPFAFKPQPKPQPKPQSPPVFSGGYGQPRPKPLQPKPPVSGFDCSAKEDGDYADGCSHVYFSCRAGQAVERTCALTALKFDSATKRCAMATFVGDCGGSPKQEQPEEIFAPVEKDERCEGKPSGIFEMPGQACSDKFLSCNDGFGEEMSCGGGSVKFDIETGSCLGRQYVAACGGQATPVPEPLKPSTRAPLDPSISCQGKEDGDYAIPDRKCAYGYFSCSGGEAELRQCPGELRFDGGLKICEEQQYIQECGGQPRPQQDQTTTHAPLVPEEEFSCAGKEDGLYDDHYGCSAVFYACSGQKASKFTCSGSLAYDPESERCVGKEFVKACGGVPTPAPEEVLDDPGTPLPPPDIDFDCQSNGEGAHSLGCSQQYVVCSFGRPYPRECATSGLRFDSETESCLAEAFVAECGGVPTPGPTQGPFLQPLPVDFDCSAKNDGLYEDPKQPCGIKFYTCSSGSAAELKCPEGLSYSAEETACVKKAACVKQPQAQPKPQFRGGYGRPQPQQAPPPAPKPQIRGYGRPQPQQAPPPAPRPAPQPSYSFVPRPRQQAPRSQPILPQKIPTFVPRPRPKPQQAPPAPQLFKPLPRKVFQPRPAFQGYGN